MFDFVRKHTKVMMFLMFLLIIPAFVLVGMDGYKGMGTAGATVATVGSSKISQGEWDAAHKNEVDRLRQSRSNVDPKLLDTDVARYATLEILVRERVLTEAVVKQHLSTTDARLARELQQDPTIASLRGADGKLDMDRYRQLAATQGLTPEGFEARVRKDLSMRQVESGVVTTALSTQALASATLNAFFERREVQLARFSPSEFVGKVVLSESDMEFYYQANAKQFQTPEVASIEYVVLDLESVKKTIALNEADVKSFYEQNVGRLSGKEERRASHILITSAKDQPAAERQKAKERAESLLLEVRKAPGSFAEVARKNSQDTGSAASGGDLDYFGRGAMVKPFEDAAFSMKKDEISAVVETDFGYHIIKVTDVKAPKQKSFEELKSVIEADLKTQQAQRKFAEIAEAFTNGVYEQSDSLKPVAERLKLDVKTASNLQRMPVATSAGVLANPKFLEAIFSSDSIEKKRNTEAVEVGSSQLASARILQYSAARTLPLAEVHASVKAKLIVVRSAELAKKEGIEKLNGWKAGGDAVLSPVLVVSREAAQPVQGPLLDALLKADTSKVPAWVGVDLGADGYAAARINKVLSRTAVSTEIAAREKAQFAQLMASAEGQAYFQFLKGRYKAQIKVMAPSKTEVSKGISK